GRSSAASCTPSPLTHRCTGNIIGVIRDESRAVLPGVSVTVTSRALPGGPSTVVTNPQGEYRFPSLPPGTYQLTVTLTGFKTYIEQDLQVTVNGTRSEEHTSELQSHSDLV